MKIAAISDIHGEFRTPEETEKIFRNIIRENPDVIVLAGDIHTGTQGADLASEIFAPSGIPTIMITGNHEYYGRRNRLDKLDDKLAATPGIHFLQNQSITIQGVMFSGTTLWTDGTAGHFDQNEILSQREKMGSGMNDYKRIHSAQAGYKKISPKHTIAAHYEATRFLRETAAVRNQETPWIVISHHAPSLEAFAHHPESNEESYPRAAYASALDDQIRAWSPSAWIHGHIHQPGKYRIENTDIFNVAYGYPDEQKSESHTIIQIP